MKKDKRVFSVIIGIVEMSEIPEHYYKQPDSHRLLTVKDNIPHTPLAFGEEFFIIEEDDDKALEKAVEVFKRISTPGFYHLETKVNPKKK